MADPVTPENNTQLTAEDLAEIWVRASGPVDDGGWINRSDDLNAQMEDAEREDDRLYVARVWSSGEGHEAD